MQIIDVQSFAMRALVIAALLAGAFAGGYMLGIRNAGDGVSDYGDGAGAAREQLSTAAEHQRELTEGIAGAETGAARVEAGIQHVAESVEQSEAAVGDAAGLIDECQQILGRVRNRGKKDPAPH